mgnify:CR=1 FL=1
MTLWNEFSNLVGQTNLMSESVGLQYFWGYFNTILTNLEDHSCSDFKRLLKLWEFELQTFHCVLYYIEISLIKMSHYVSVSTDNNENSVSGPSNIPPPK